MTEPTLPNRPRVIWLGWPDYLRWLGGELRQAPNAAGEMLALGAPLEPGHHMAVIGPTGCAKLPRTRSASSRPTGAMC